MKEEYGDTTTKKESWLPGDLKKHKRRFMLGNRELWKRVRRDENYAIRRKQMGSKLQQIKV